MTQEITFVKTVLTREAAEKTGHIAWIEDAEPARAIARMRQAVLTAPFNCAVWVNSWQGAAPLAAQAIARWRENFHYSFRSNLLPEENFAGTLRTMFDTAAARPSPELELTEAQRLSFAFGLAALRDFAAVRLGQLVDALHPAQLYIRPRVNLNSRMMERQNFHTDPVKNPGSVRFIDAIACPHVLLTANENTQPLGDNHYGLAEKPVIEIFEAPPESFVLLTQPAGQTHAPILHSENFALKPGQERLKRSIITYDATCG